MKRREFSKVVPSIALMAAAMPAVGAPGGKCDDGVMSFDEFKDQCWEHVAAGAASRGGTFGSAAACRKAYETYDSGKWHDNFKKRFSEDTDPKKNNKNPCTDVDDYFTKHYFVCAAKAGQIAASIAEVPGAITAEEFAVAMSSVKTLMVRLRERGVVAEREYLCT